MFRFLEIQIYVFKTPKENYFNNMTIDEVNIEDGEIKFSFVLFDNIKSSISFNRSEVSEVLNFKICDPQSNVW